MRKPVLNEKLFIVNCGLYSRDAISKGYCCVVKVGRKYFEVKKEGSHGTIKFYINTWREKSQYRTNNTLYESERDFLNEKKRDKYFNEVKKYFSYKNKNLTLEQLKKIAEILNVEVEFNEKIKEENK